MVRAAAKSTRGETARAMQRTAPSCYNAGNSAAYLGEVRRCRGRYAIASVPMHWLEHKPRTQHNSHRITQAENHPPTPSVPEAWKAWTLPTCPTLCRPVCCSKSRTNARSNRPRQRQTAPLVPIHLQTILETTPRTQQAQATLRRANGVSSLDPNATPRPGRWRLPGRDRVNYRYSWGRNNVLIPERARNMSTAASQSVSGKECVISGLTSTVPCDNSRTARTHDSGVLALLPVTVSSL